jgi:hypothetical protein
MWKKIAVTAIVLVIAAFIWLIRQPSGIATSDPLPALAEPLQTDLKDGEAQTIVLNKSGYEWRITPKAKYSLRGRVLSTARYRFGWKSTASPVDFALGWGEFEKKDVDKWIRWSQGNRWYFYRWKEGCPYSDEEIISHTANVHIIPATDNLWNAVTRVKEDQSVYLEGFLIDAKILKKGSDYFWNSSLSRTDTGNASCEVFYVTELTWQNETYT